MRMLLPENALQETCMMRLRTFSWIPVLALISCGPPPSGGGNQAEINWKLSPGTTADYKLVRQKRLMQGQFTETDDIPIHLATAPDGTVTATVSGAASPSFQLAGDGTLSPRNVDVPLIARYLLMLAGPNGKQIREGTSYEVKVPADDELAGLENEVVIQLSNRITVRKIREQNGEVFADLDVVGQQRLVANAGLRELIGKPDGTPTSIAAEKAMADLAEWNYYMLGNATWNVTRGLPARASFLVTVAPHYRPRKEDVQQSALRNTLAYTLQ